MQEQIKQWLENVSMKHSSKKVRQMVAEHFGGITTSNGRYVKIQDVEFRIEKDVDKGWQVREMDWRHGNDWKYSHPY